jgi:hypothetical protein
VRRYLDVLTSTFVVRQLAPFSANIGKRQVKSPKVYLADSGLLHSLLDVESLHSLEGHPKIGASWEGFALAVVTRYLHCRPEESFFWATHSGAELDLLVIKGSVRLGFEFTCTVSPRLSPSMCSAIVDLHLTRAYVVHVGDSAFPLSSRVRAVPLASIAAEIPAG